VVPFLLAEMAEDREPMFDKSAPADLGRRSLIRAQRGRKAGQSLISAIPPCPPVKKGSVVVPFLLAEMAEDREPLPLAQARGAPRSKWSTGPFRLLRKPLFAQLTYIVCFLRKLSQT
jgi:hypothetical protein